MIACRERAKSFSTRRLGPGLLVEECLRQALNERLIGSLGVAGKALVHPQALGACGWAR
jgi:hypothetical protein